MMQDVGALLNYLRPKPERTIVPAFLFEIAGGLCSRFIAATNNCCRRMAACRGMAST
jgi:hypothetical protein